jgi:hypothetical protein
VPEIDKVSGQLAQQCDSRACHRGLDPQSIVDQALSPLRGGCRIKSGMTSFSVIAGLTRNP